MTGFVLAHWDYAERAERRYKRIIGALVALYLVFGVIIPFIKLVGQEKGGGDAGKTRYAQMVQRQAPVAKKEEEPKPQPEPTKDTEPPKPQKQTKPTPEPPTQQQQVQQARAVAQRSGLLAMAKDLADLRNSTLTQLDSSHALKSSEAAAGGADNGSDASAAFSASAGSGSGGITTSTPGNGQRNPNGTRLDARKTTTVKSPVGFGQDPSRPGQGGDKLLAGRTLEEIQLTFDRSKAAFYAIFNRAQRENAGMGAGKIVVSITIAPDGSVTECKLVSSSFGNPELENKIVQRVKLLNFGAKDVPPFTYPNYPINYLPS
ncbi:MAG: energy transducer TonB [Nevskiaceae bacterium]|nr:MAG: energy transducer TonB [Nevskiaceae bacterium]